MTQKEIAERLNISRALVSHALNGRKGVNEETRKKVLDLAGKLNYRNDIFASAMRRGSSNFIGNIFCRGFHSVESHSDMVQKEADRNGYHCMNINVFSGSENGRLLDLLYSNFFGGIIINLNNPEIMLSDKKISEITKNLETPHVFYGAKADQFNPCVPVVVCDVEKGYEKITEFLLEKGAERFVFIGSGSSSNKKKCLAVKNILKKNGFKGKCFSSFMPPRGKFSPFAIGERALSEIDVSKYDAAICANDIYAAGFINEAVRRGLKVPEQIKVTGCDNLLQAEFSIVPITSINIFSQELVKKTVKKLIDIINGKKVPELDVISPLIVERESAG